MSNEYKNISDEIEVSELLHVIWKKKWFILLITLVFVLISVAFSINQPNQYKSEVVLYPVESTQVGGIGALKNQLGGLASIAGINLAGDKGSKTELALEVLKSRQFISDFIIKRNILKELMAAKSWQLDGNQIVYDGDIYDIKNGSWVRAVVPPKESKPSLQEAYNKFIKLLSISKETDSGMIVISLEFISPYLAQQWLNWLIEDINLVMKEMDVNEANISTKFLAKQLDKTQISDIRAVLYRLIEEQTKTIMFANVREEYVFKVIDPPLVPEKKSGPKRALICLLGAILGGILGVLIVIVRYFLLNNTSNKFGEY